MYKVWFEYSVTLHEMHQPKNHVKSTCSVIGIGVIEAFYAKCDIVDVFALRTIFYKLRAGIAWGSSQSFNRNLICETVFADVLIPTFYAGNYAGLAGLCMLAGKIRVVALYANPWILTSNAIRMYLPARGATFYIHKKLPPPSEIVYTVFLAQLMQFNAFVQSTQF